MPIGISTMNIHEPQKLAFLVFSGQKEHNFGSSLRALEPRGQKEARAQVALQSLCLRWGHRKHLPAKYQWIGWGENLQEKPSLFFNGKIYGFRLRFSLIPIHYNPLIYVQQCPRHFAQEEVPQLQPLLRSQIYCSRGVSGLSPVEPPWCLIPSGNLT